MQWILGSRSPRRLELLRSFDPQANIRILPPTSPDEAGFDGLETFLEIQQRCQSIVQAKLTDVLGQLAGPVVKVEEWGSWEDSLVLCADTTVIARKEDGTYLSLGQPPADEPGFSTLRYWLGSLLAGKTHSVMTACALRQQDGVVRTGAFLTQVTFRQDVSRLLDWYLATGESAGKAGGYAIQGAGSVLVQKIEGSFSNVVGLPLELLSEWVHPIDA